MSKSGRPVLSIVVPVHNEEASHGPLDAELRAALDEMDRPAEIVYVDDRSTDGSARILAELAGRAASSAYRTRVVMLGRATGQTAAMAAGFDLAEGTVVVPIDGDGQNDPRDIPRLLAKLDEGYDVVSGWRRDRRDHFWSRRLPSWVANRLIAWFTEVPLHDHGCTLKAYRADVLKRVRLYGEMHRFLPLYLAQSGARLAELPVAHRARSAGTSKYGAERVLKVAVDLVLVRFMANYFHRPMHFFGRVAFSFLAAMVVVGGFMVVFKYGWLHWLGIDYQASFIETPLPALAATFLIGAIVSIFFGILAEILIRVYHESQDLRPYRIANILDSQREEADKP